MLSMNSSWSWWIAATTALGGLAGLTAYGAVHPSSQLFGPTISSTNAARKLALTFDDGPNQAITPKLLNLLDRYNAKAVFFVIGKHVRECPALTKEIHARGHVLGNHTDTHPNLFFCGPSETRRELRGCSEAILHATWESPRWFRPPFGYRSPWLNEIVHQLEMRTVTWSQLPGDWRANSVEWLTWRLQPIAMNALQAMGKNATTSKPTSGDILCLHDGDSTRLNGDRALTLAALEYWLPRWRDLGLEFVTMAQAAEGPD
jgi:peptidoglycan/xylan/chitin deacetylase (PgdA/CDA1 family)